MLGLSLLLTSLLMGMSVPSVSSTTIHRANEDKTTKTVYIDFSENGFFLEHLPSLSYEDKEGNSTAVSLVEAGEHTYFSETPLLVSLFNDVSFYFSVTIEESVTRYLLDDSSHFADGGINYVRLSSSLNEGEAPSVSGEYGYYGDNEKDSGATYATQRIWFYDEKLDENKKNAVYYRYKDVDHVLVMTSLDNAYDHKVYLYSDIPFEVESISFLKIENSNKKARLVYEAAPIILTYGVCYFSSYDADGAYDPIRGNVAGAGALLLKHVVEAFITYGKAPSNGPALTTIANVFYTWFEQKSATKDDLKEAKLLDYTGYAANGNSYEGLEKTATYSVNEKWNGLCSQAGVDPNTGALRSFDIGGLRAFLRTSSNYILGGLVGLLVLIEVIVILIRRKHAAR